MFGSVVLEVALGIIFIFILFSIMCSCIREGVEALLKTRAAYLEAGIRELLNDKTGDGIVKSFYTHPLIYSLFNKEYKPGKSSGDLSLFERGRDLPSYVPAKNFALTLMDIAARGPETDEVSGDYQSPQISLKNIRTNIANLDNPYVQRAVLTAIDTAQGDLNKAQLAIQDWFDSAMDRVSGWYKRATYWILFWIGLILAVVLNINTLTIADYLFQDDVARQALVARAEAAAKDSPENDMNYQEALQALNELHLPIGWSDGAKAGKRYAQYGAGTSADEEGTIHWWNDVFKIALGWIITALAAAVGAPFWFDLLNKVMVIRSTVKPHEKSPEESSEDRQMKKPVLNEGIEDRGMGPVAPVLPPDRTTDADHPNIRDKQSAIDNCSVGSDMPTADEDLPEAKGGVTE